MKNQYQQSVSIWMTNAKVPEYARLSRDARTDVCVVGAGIAGLTTAYMLAREGRSVIVLNDGPIVCGETQRTTAHLSNALDDRYSEIEKIHGEEGARVAAESHSAAIDQIESIVREEGIDCDFTRLDGYLFEPPGGSVDALEKECDAAQRAGLWDVTLVPQAPLPTFDTGPSLRFPRQGQFHPRKYLAALAKAIVRMGGQIHTGITAKNIEGDEILDVDTRNGPRVRANAVVVATNTPFNDLVAIHTKQAPYLSYVIGATVPLHSIKRALYWDDWYTDESYHYIRLHSELNDRDTLIVGGEDHKAGQAEDQEDRWNRLEAWARERFPMMQSITHRWSGMVMETIDGLAFIGRNPGNENVFVATGDSGMGMTHGTIAGILLTDLIQGRENAWSKTYDPSRKPVSGRALKSYLSENVNVAKEFIKDRLTGGEVDSVEEIQPGEGALLRRGLSKVAIYRDEWGKVHERSAVCPHVGCIVHWNNAEKSWDCPCHGSRFNALGEVISGPATSPLEKVHDESAARVEATRK